MNIYLYKERRDGATLRYAFSKVGHRRGVSGKSFGGSVARRRASRHRRYLSTNQKISISTPTNKKKSYYQVVNKYISTKYIFIKLMD